MKYMIFLVLLLTTSLSALTNDQTLNLKVAYNIGSQIKADDGFSFEKTLCAIMLQESSAGRELIGDRYEDGRLKSLYDSSLGIFQIKLNTAKYIIKTDKFCNKYFKHLLKNHDKILINLLLTSSEFSSIIAATYLKMNYNVALHRGYRNPWHSAISKYNGGWKNTTYKTKIFKRLEYVRTLEIF